MFEGSSMVRFMESFISPQYLIVEIKKLCKNCFIIRSEDMYGSFSFFHENRWIGCNVVTSCRMILKTTQLSTTVLNVGTEALSGVMLSR
jgi:hypothetical protein